MIKLELFNPGPGPKSISGSSTTQLLSGSQMDDMTVMLRETVQNSWDARGKSEEIEYEYKGILLSDEEIANLSECIGHEKYGSRVVNYIQENNRSGIQISDINTLGLIGDITYDNNHKEISRFLKFVFEVGNSEQGIGAGGSFGYGKASIYKASSIGTVAIYSRIKLGLFYEERFIIKSIDRFESKKNNASDVYWWGEEIYYPGNSHSASMLPLTGEMAADVAESLGMNVLRDDQTGTVILIYEPFIDLDEDQNEMESHGFPTAERDVFDKLKDVVTEMQRTSIHHFWAKYSNHSKGIIFKFSIRDLNGYTKTLDMADPYRISPYNRLLECLNTSRVAKDEFIETETKKMISTSRPSEQLGILSWFELTDTDINPTYLHFFNSGKSCVALMRNVEFVVKYMDVYVNFSNVEQAAAKMVLGVYRTLDGVIIPRYKGDEKGVLIEELYRAAENQTHGEWNHQSLKELGNWCSTYIKQTPVKIQETISDIYREEIEDAATYNSIPDAENMIFLGQFINGIQGGGLPVTGSRKLNQNGARNGGYSKLRPILEYIKTEETKRENDLIQSIHLFNVKNEESDQVLSIYPVCPDEEGKMNIRTNEKTTIPVAIKSVSVIGEHSSQVQIGIAKNGTISLLSKLTEYKILVMTEAVTDCRYALNIETM